MYVRTHLVVVTLWSARCQNPFWCPLLRRPRLTRSYSRTTLTKKASRGCCGLFSTAWHGLVWAEKGYNGINTIMAQTAPHRPCTLHTVFSMFVVWPHCILYAMQCVMPESHFTAFSTWQSVHQCNFSHVLYLIIFFNERVSCVKSHMLERTLQCENTYLTAAIASRHCQYGCSVCFCRKWCSHCVYATLRNVGKQVSHLASVCKPSRRCWSIWMHYLLFT